MLVSCSSYGVDGEWRDGTVRATDCKAARGIQSDSPGSQQRR